MEPSVDSLKHRVDEATRLDLTTAHLNEVHRDHLASTPSDPRECVRNATQAELDMLWKRVEEARQQWKSAHEHANEIHEDRFSGGMPTADGSYAHLQAIHAQRLAVENYHRALQDFNAALVGGSSEPAPATEPTAANGEETITPREREVLALIAEGKSSKQIAAELGIAFRTAVCHRSRLYQKLNVHTSVELARAALRMGLVEL